MTQCLSTRQRTSASCAQHSPTAATRNSTSFLLRYSCQRPRAETNLFSDFTATHELRVNKIEEIKQRLVSLAKLKM